MSRLRRTSAWWARRWQVFAGPQTRLPAPLLPLVAAAWGLMLWHSVSHGGHEAHVARGVHAPMSATTEAAHWMLMVVAMMLPLLGPTLSEVRRTTYPPAHPLAVSAYLLGWLFPWLLLAAPVAGLRQLDLAHSPTLAGLAFIASAAWALTGWHARALMSCGLRRPLAPGGLPLLRSASREGSHAGLECCVSCGPLMVACTLTGHSVVAMLGGFALGWLERSTYRPSTRIGAAMALALGVWFLL
jgi:hypothetical protein